MLAGAGASGCSSVGAASGSVGGGIERPADMMPAPTGKGGQVSTSVGTGGNVKATAAAPFSKTGGAWPSLGPIGAIIGGATDTDGGASTGGAKPGGATEDTGGTAADDGAFTPTSGAGGMGDTPSGGGTLSHLGAATLGGSAGDSRLAQSVQLNMQFCRVRAEFAPAHIPAAASSTQDANESTQAAGGAKLACGAVEPRESGGAKLGGDPTGGNAT
jgi:hypothetical protein